MTTQINVTVGSGGLSDRVKQQQKAARQAQLEKERQERIEAEAKTQREAKLAAEGRGPDGQPQFGAPPPKPRPQDEPAANRVGGTPVGHGWYDIDSTDTYEPSNLSPAGLVHTGTGQSSTVGSSGSYPVQGLDKVTLTNGVGTTTLDFSSSFVYTQAALPTQGYTWAPTFVPVWTGPDFGWYGVGYGLRTARWPTLLYSNQATMVLPIGKDAFIFIVMAYSAGAEIHVSEMHRVSTAPQGGTVDNNPLPAGWESQFNSYLVPGAQVPVGCFTGPGTPTPLPPCPLPVITTASTITQHVNAVYYCSNTAVREITPSSSVVAMLEHFNPPLTTQTYNVRGTNVNVPYTTGFTALPSATPAAFTGIGFHADPKIYANINALYPYTDPSSILDGTSGIEHRLKDDNTKQAYEDPFNSVNYFNGAKPFYYSRKPFTASPESPYGNSKLALRLRFGRPVKAAGTSFTFIRVWDWGLPSYCRQQALALGFTESDLSP